jgi:hypothetical protein
MSVHQRREVRLTSENTLSVTLLPGQKVESWAGRNIQVLSKDISVSGLCCRLPGFVPLGTRFKVEITLASPRRLVSTIGTVKWVRPASNTAMYDAGVEFDFSSPDFTNALTDYIAAHTGGR